MRRLHILTPSPELADYHREALGQARAYVDAFAGHGLDLRPLPWTDPQAGTAPALALLAWGYHLDLPSWIALLDRWPADVPLFNAPDLLRWNTRKTYLAELEAAGVPTVPTLFGPSRPDAFDALGADEIIVKPQVSAGSYETHRLRRGDTVPDLPDAMTQPFLPAIADEGEYSLFYIGGELTHAIVKRATGGDFRIQPQFGGINERWTPDTEALAVAIAALAAAPTPTTYARIDLLRRLDGRLALIEFEAIEPDLYFHHGEEVLERLAGVVAASL
jgi:hypothetical protein